MKTAVEWLEIVLISEPYSEEDFEHNERCWEQAKEMEKKYIVDTYVVGYGKGITHGAINAENYYNQTFNQ
jgi:HD superfamily phosphodiesterase